MPDASFETLVNVFFLFFWGVVYILNPFVASINDLQLQIDLGTAALEIMGE